MSDKISDAIIQLTTALIKGDDYRRCEAINDIHRLAPDVASDVVHVLVNRYHETNAIDPWGRCVLD